MTDNLPDGDTKSSDTRPIDVWGRPIPWYMLISEEAYRALSCLGCSTVFTTVAGAVIAGLTEHNVLRGAAIGMALPTLITFAATLLSRRQGDVEGFDAGFIDTGESKE